MSERPAIPADMKRQVLVESGHRCAIPTCRQMVGVNIHHIVPWEICKEHKAENLIVLCANCHAHVHDNKIDRKALHMYKANLQLLHDRFTKFEVDVLFHCYKNGSSPFQKSLCLLVKRLLDCGYVRFGEIDIYIGGHDMNGKEIDASPCYIYLTDEGKEYVEVLINAKEITE